MSKMYSPSKWYQNLKFWVLAHGLIVDAAEQRKLEEKLDSLLTLHMQYVSNLLCSKHQSEY